MRFSSLALFTSALALSGTAAAEQVDQRWHVSPMVGYIWADEDRGVDFDGVAGQINIGNAINEKMDLDFRLQYFDMGDTLEQLGAGIEATWFKSRTAKVTPLFTVGAGWINNDFTTNPNADDSFVLDAGLGLQATLNDHGLALRGDIRQRLDFSDNSADDFSDTMLLVGLVVPVGAKAQPAAAAPTPAQDSDNDGVNDDKDACPGTLAGVIVDSTGCPKDSDRDGVVDGLDACPNSKKGAVVDRDGCEVKKAADAVTTVTVYFALDSAELSEAAKAKLLDVASTMNKRKYIVAVATGHTDSTGSPEYNLGLSRERANSVKAFLVENGVATANVIAKGVGEADPTSSNESRSGREQNRRVEVRLLDQ